MRNWHWHIPTSIVAAADGKPATFSMIAYTGGKLALKNFPAPVVVDLQGLQCAPKIVANHYHESQRPVGTVDAISNDGRQLIMSGTLNHAGQDRDEILASVRDGFAYEASIEANGLEYETVRDGQSVIVNEQTITGPAIIARRSVLYGVAFVPLGASVGTTVQIAASAAQPTGDRKMTFEQWLESLKIDIKAMADDQVAEIKAAYAAVYPDKKQKKAASAVAGDDDDKWSAEDIRAAYDAQLDAVDALELELADEYEAGTIKAELTKAKKAIRDIKAKAVRGRWSDERFSLESERAINAARVDVIRNSRPTGPAIHSSARDLSGQVIEAALCQTLKIKGVDESFDDKTLQAAHSTFRGRIGLQQLLILAAAHNGMNVIPGARLTDANLREVLGHAFGDPRYARNIHATGFATVGLTGILSNVANKEILQGYMAEDQAWREVAEVKSVPDFKQMTSYRLLDSLEYEMLPADGRIKHGTITEESYTRQAKTYAKMLAITRVDIINDDMGAFDDMRTRIGRGAALTLNTVFWTAFLDNSSFFTSGRGNYISGPTTNLGTDGVGLGLGVKAFRTMTSPSTDGSKPVGVSMRPTKIVVPPELEVAARTLFTANNISNVKGSDGNIYANLYRPVVVNQLSNSAFTGYSTTAWYLFGDTLAPMVVSFLNGVETPTVESSYADFDQLGIQFRGYHDFGCDKAAYLAGVKSKGAA